MKKKLYLCNVIKKKGEKNMTVQELINELNKVQDKAKDVCFSYDFGTDEMGEPLIVIDVTETMDCVILI